MYALVIGCSSESVFAINLAKEMGLTVIAFDGNENAQGLVYADKYFVVDISDYKNIINVLEKENINDIKLILPVPVGRILTTVGKLNDYYNLVGVTYENADMCTDKYVFHNKLYEEKLRNISCTLIDKYTELDRIIIDENKKYILKPRFGAGSYGVAVVSNAYEVKKHIEQYGDVEYILEELVDGVEYGVDAMVIDDEFELVLLREKILTEMPNRQCVGYYSVFDDEIVSIISEYVKNICKVLNLKNCLLHADIMYKDGVPFVIEISPRPSGHNLHNMFTIMATNINMVLIFIKYALGEKWDIQNRTCNNMLIKYFDFENVKILKQPDFENLIDRGFNIVKYKVNLKNEYNYKIKNGADLMERGYFVISGDNKAELEKISNEILDEFKLEVISSE